MNPTVAIADDHIIFRQGFANILKELNYDVLFEAGNGRDLLQKLEIFPTPQIVIMDINMPVMDGFEATSLLKKQYPAIKVLAISMNKNPGTIDRILACGANAYYCKDSPVAELQKALESLPG